MTTGTLYSPPPKPAWRTPCGVHVLIAAFLSLALLTASATAQAGDVKARFDLTATPRVIDEGELVEFGMENLAHFDVTKSRLFCWRFSASDH